MIEPAPRNVNGLAVHTYHDIRDADPEVWDSILQPRDIQCSCRFIRTCQEARIENAVYRHLMLFDRAGLAAVATLSFMHVSLELLATRRIRGAVSVMRRLAPTFLRVPVLFCGLPLSFGRPCLRIRTDADATAVAKALHQLMADAGRELGAEVYCFKEFTPAEASRIDALEHHGYFRAASLPSCHMDLPWHSFDEYLCSMRSGYRRQIAKSLQVRERSGLTLHITEDFGAHADAIHRLYTEVMDRVEFQLERLNLEFFRSLNRNFPSEARAILAEHGGALVGAAILLASGAHIAFLLVGIDYARNRTLHVYPNLVTEVVAAAIRAGARELELGQTSYDIKRRHGAYTTPRIIFVRHRSPVLHPLLRAGRRLLFRERVYAPSRVFRAT